MSNYDYCVNTIKQTYPHHNIIDILFDIVDNDINDDIIDNIQKKYKQNEQNIYLLINNNIVKYIIILKYIIRITVDTNLKFILQNMNEKNECLICYEDIKNSYFCKLCGKQYCLLCMLMCYIYDFKCPYCNQFNNINNIDTRLLLKILTMEILHDSIT